MKLRLMSNNQWKCDKNCPEWEAKGMDCSAPARAKGFVRLYSELAPDMVGLQESSGKMSEEILWGLAEKDIHYAMLWGGATPILYRPEKFELLDSVCALYPTEYPGHEGAFNDARSKSYNMGVFREKAEGKIFIFISTHLWWKNENPDSKNYQAGSHGARAYQIGLMMDRAEQLRARYGNCPVIAVGDLNADYRSLAVQAAFDRGYLHGHDIAAEYACEEHGYHWCGRDGFVPYVPKPFEHAIDHILIKGAPEGFVRRFDRYTPEYYLSISDHSPVWVDVEL